MPGTDARQHRGWQVEYPLIFFYYLSIRKLTRLIFFLPWLFPPWCYKTARPLRGASSRPDVLNCHLTCIFAFWYSPLDYVSLSRFAVCLASSYEICYKASRINMHCWELMDNFLVTPGECWTLKMAKRSCGSVIKGATNLRFPLWAPLSDSNIIIIFLSGNCRLYIKFDACDICIVLLKQNISYKSNSNIWPWGISLSLFYICVNQNV